MTNLSIFIDQNGGEYTGTCDITTNTEFTTEKTNYKTIVITFENGTTVELKFDERIEL